MRTNRTPFMDVCGLVSFTSSTDADGYESNSETVRTVFCSFANGITYKEFYEALKSDVQLTATAEIWEDDWNKERVFRHDNTDYNIVRVYPSGHGTLYLSLAEVIH